MPRESARDKAGRILLEGRVVVTEVTPRTVVASVRGEGAIHVTRWSGTDWTCSCPHVARSTFCSHIHALRRITAVDLEERGR